MAGRLLDLRLAVIEGGERSRRARQVRALADVDLDHVAARPLLELGRRPGRHDPAVVDDHDPAGQVVRLVQVLGGQQDVGAPLDQRVDGVPQLDAAAGVQPAGRLVEQQQPRRAHQARPEVQLAAHAA
jgi:hypothetical protein